MSPELIPVSIALSEKVRKTLQGASLSHVTFPSILDADTLLTPGWDVEYSVKCLYEGHNRKARR